MSSGTCHSAEGAGEDSGHRSWTEAHGWGGQPPGRSPCSELALVTSWDGSQQGKRSTLLLPSDLLKRLVGCPHGKPEGQRACYRINQVILRPEQSGVGRRVDPQGKQGRSRFACRRSGDQQSWVTMLFMNVPLRPWVQASSTVDHTASAW